MGKEAFSLKTVSHQPPIFVFGFIFNFFLFFFQFSCQDSPEQKKKKTQKDDDFDDFLFYFFSIRVLFSFPGLSSGGLILCSCFVIVAK